MKASRTLSVVKPERDAYGQEIWHCYKGHSAYEIVERDDGLIDIGSALPYFQELANWPAHERRAIQLAHGRVLDVGCGAGRVTLHLQKKGHAVLAIDNSPLAIRVAKLRGVKTARVLSIRDIHTLRPPFDSIVLFGNNFGLFGSKARARQLLREMSRITSPGGTILAAAADPYRTRDPVHLAYQERNRQRGRMSGQLRVRIRHRQYRGDWFDYLFASATEVREIVADTGWNVTSIVESPGPGFVAILKKA